MIKTALGAEFLNHLFWIDSEDIFPEKTARKVVFTCAKIIGFTKNE
jgi:hypothetical protein